MAPDLIVGQWYPTGTFVESYRGYDLYIKSGGFFETGNVAADAVIEIRPAFDNQTFQFRVYARQHIDEHCTVIGTCPPVTICTPNWQCRTPLDGYEHDINNCPGSVDKLNSRCNPPICTPNWQCRTPLDGYEHDINNCPGSVDKLNSRCNPPGATYSCINNVCTLFPCTPGTANCYTTFNCNLLCTAPPPPITCPTGQVNILGTCTPTMYIIAGGAGLLLLMLAKR